MAKRRERFPFVERDARLGAASLAPVLPALLRIGSRSAPVSGMIDTGASISLLPRSIGNQLGARWQAAPPIPLAGNLAGIDARGLKAEMAVGNFDPVEVAFAWADTDAVPVLFGQINFLFQFDVLLSRSGGWFEVWPAAPAPPARRRKAPPG